MEDLLALIGILTLPLSAGLGMAWYHARRELRALRQERNGPAGDHLVRLEQAVEAIAIEVERISEGQRFTARLLAERPAPDRSSPRPSA